MTRIRRRIRGALGVALTWAAAWFGAGMVLLVIVGPDAADVPFPLGFGLLGFLAGAGFSVVLGLFGRKRRFGQMTVPRFAGWGALGGLLLAALFLPAVALGGDDPRGLLGVIPLFATLGAVSAAGSLAIARRAAGGAVLDTAGDDALRRLTDRPAR